MACCPARKTRCIGVVDVSTVVYPRSMGIGARNAEQASGEEVEWRAVSRGIRARERRAPPRTAGTGTNRRCRCPCVLWPSTQYASGDLDGCARSLGDELALASTLKRDEPPDGSVDRTAGGDQAVVLMDHRLVVAERLGHFTADFCIEYHGAHLPSLHSATSL